MKDTVAEAIAQLGSVTPQEASSELDAGTAVLIDGREPTEWEHHVAGALQVPRGLLEFAADPSSPRHLAGLDPSNRIIVMCRSGARSALAGVTSRNMGFGDVHSLVGGFTAWTAAGLPTAEHTADL